MYPCRPEANSESSAFSAAESIPCSSGADAGHVSPGQDGANRCWAHDGATTAAASTQVRMTRIFSPLDSGHSIHASGRCSPDVVRRLRLARYPKSGRLIPEFPDLPYREVTVSPYRFFYRAEGKTIWVVAVCHGAPIPDEPVVK